MNILLDQKLSDIVMSSPSAAKVFEKYRLDFCCKGRRTLKEACDERHISAEEVGRALGSANGPDPEHVLFSSMDPVQLCNYIVIRHHFFVRQYIPVILGHLHKVASKHGERYPHTVKVYQLFQEVADDLLQHMQKEEQVLFPMIAAHAGAVSSRYEAPISVMEMEHEKAGELMDQIREITQDYTPPADACTTHQVTLRELRMFEEDLHKHVYLENHILFPSVTGKA